MNPQHLGPVDYAGIILRIIGVLGNIPGIIGNFLRIIRHTS